jgi:class 3 adenylate cyclase
LISGWRRLGRDLGFGAGIAQGYPTLGQIGFSGCSGYTSIGAVCNIAARLCAEATNGQILISQGVAARLGDNISVEDIRSLAPKGQCNRSSPTTCRSAPASQLSGLSKAVTERLSVAEAAPVRPSLDGGKGA